MTSTRAFGIEIEAFGLTLTRACEVIRAAGVACNVEGYNHNTRAQWKVVTDASVDDGFEVVSPILRGAEGMEEARKVFEALKAAGAKVDRRCGFHVHVDARDLAVNQVANVVKAYVQYEESFDKLVPASRRGNANRFCMSVRRAIGGENVAAAFAKVNACESIYQLRNLLSRNRYHKLNLESLVRHGTVEFRQHSGTVEHDKALAWVALAVGLVDGVTAYKSIRPDVKQGDIEKLLQYAPGKARTFLRRRAEALATAN